MFKLLFLGFGMAILTLNFEASGADNLPKNVMDCLNKVKPVAEKYRICVDKAVEKLIEKTEREGGTVTQFFQECSKWNTEINEKTEKCDVFIQKLNSEQKEMAKAMIEEWVAG